jgi:hypothetical protein
MSADGWQPIETVPEREWVRVRGKGWEAERAWLDGQSAELKGFEMNGSGMYYGRRSITHWMPLPKPPA